MPFVGENAPQKAAHIQMSLIPENNFSSQATQLKAVIVEAQQQPRDAPGKRGRGGAEQTTADSSAVRTVSRLFQALSRAASTGVKSQ